MDDLLNQRWQHSNELDSGPPRLFESSGDKRYGSTSVRLMLLTMVLRHTFASTRARLDRALMASAKASVGHADTKNIRG